VIELVIEFPDVVQENIQFNLWDTAFIGPDDIILLLDCLKEPQILIMDYFIVHSEEIFQLI